MAYPVMTQANAARLSSGKDRCSAGNATFTIDRSNDAMNAPRAVTKKTAPRCVFGGTISISSLIELTLFDCVS